MKSIYIILVFLAGIFSCGCWVRTPSFDSAYTKEIGKSYYLGRDILVHKSPLSNVSFDLSERTPDTWPFVVMIKKGNLIKINGLIKRLETRGFKIYYICESESNNVRFDMDLSQRDCIGLPLFKYSN